MKHETEKFFFSVTEASRLTGIDKKGIYNKIYAKSFCSKHKNKIAIRSRIAFENPKCKIFMCRQCVKVISKTHITGISKFDNLNMTIAKNQINIVNSKRVGRKFTETLISFDDVVTLSPAFYSLYLSRILNLFTLFGETGLAFRVNEVTWLLGLSNQWVFGQIKKGVLPVKLRRREHRSNDEKLILAQDLRKLKDEPMNIKEKVFELFTLKKTNG